MTKFVIYAKMQIPLNLTTRERKGAPKMRDQTVRRYWRNWAIFMVVGIVGIVLMLCFVIKGSQSLDPPPPSTGYRAEPADSPMVYETKTTPATTSLTDNLIPMDVEFTADGDTAWQEMAQDLHRNDACGIMFDWWSAEPGIRDLRREVFLQTTSETFSLYDLSIEGETASDVPAMCNRAIICSAMPGKTAVVEVRGDVSGTKEVKLSLEPGDMHVIFLSSSQHDPARMSFVRHPGAKQIYVHGYWWEIATYRPG